MPELLEMLKGYFIPILVRWVAKIGGTWLVTAGWGEDDLRMIIGGVLSIIIGIIVSLVNHKSASKKDPNVKTDG